MANRQVPLFRSRPRAPLGRQNRDPRVNDCGVSRHPIPICSQVNNYDCDELWTSPGFVVDGLAAQLRGFRKSHHFIPAGPNAPDDRDGEQGMQSAGTHD